MTSNMSPPQGANPVDDFLPPPRSSVLTEGSVAGIPPQQHTTLIDTAVYPVEPNQIPRPTLLKENQLPPSLEPPSMSILPEAATPQTIPPPKVSVLPSDLLDSLSVPKRPNLVRPMPKPKAE